VSNSFILQIRLLLLILKGNKSDAVPYKERPVNRAGLALTEEVLHGSATTKRIYGCGKTQQLFPSL
jgi:hypothetical protein